MGGGNYLEGRISHMAVLRSKVKCEMCGEASGVRSCRARGGSEWE